ncbi:hypothetical protein GCM10010261_38070 [Streptomyces pilosus]|nr:hypothetical protein GCM10010261_38070 [Streptomyces pilosus]
MRERRRGPFPEGCPHLPEPSSLARINRRCPRAAHDPRPDLAATGTHTPTAVLGGVRSPRAGPAPTTGGRPASPRPNPARPPALPASCHNGKLACRFPGVGARLGFPIPG